MTVTIKRAAAASVAALALTATCIGAAHAAPSTQQTIQANISATAVHPQTPLQTVKVAGFKIDRHAKAGTAKILTANTQLAAASANVCGAGYTISTGAWRYGTWGTTYTWTNGNTTGPNYEDKPICAVFFNDTGSAHYMGMRLSTNYTSIRPVQNFDTYSSYAGPVYQSKGYCGTVYSYMKAPNGAVVVDNDQTVGACD